MDFQLHCGAWNQMFPVPNAVADHFLKLASPDASGYCCTCCGTATKP